ncbi:pilus assembly protein CpaD [Sphingomonas aerolata]|uniref:Pilus assembly protein CpaD n=1 Tax=Sphingomonas aerolata TaxID=185951 RepID=A0A2T4YTI3_9SPHN|nr:MULTISPECIES: CpaD family pilus assembly protein [Sphingomonas]MBB3588303.1 pilus assembly protein CpaD [Sphingomonas sp. BK481]PTM47109.1 pilus assembly protein CpaD [Sphingomonas aerolata]
MTKHPILLLSLGSALLLGGCMGTENRGLESVHQPVVSRANYALDLGTAGGTLAQGEARRLAGWMTTMRVGYGDRVAIDDPAGQAPMARAEIADVVAGYGLLLSPDTPVTQAPVSPGAIRIVVTRMRADVPGCPDWSRDASIDIASHTSSNYGCAMNRNLAAMVARPEDLVRGSGDTETYDPASSFKAIDVYRRAVPTGANNALRSETTGGK